MKVFNIDLLERYIWNQGIVCMLLSGVLFVSGKTLIKSLVHVPISEIVFTRSILSLVLIFTVLYIQKVPHKFGKPEHIRLLIFRGFFGALSQLCFFSALRMIPMADVISVNFLYVIFVLPFSWLLFKESIRLLTLVGIFLAVVGAIFTTQPTYIMRYVSIQGLSIKGSFPAIGYLLAICTSCFDGSTFLIVRYIGDKEHSLVLSVFMYIFASIDSGFSATIGWPDQLVIPNLRDSCLTLILNVNMLVALTLQLRGIQLNSMMVSCVLNFNQLIYSYLVDLLIFQIQPNFLGVIGTTNIAAGILVINLDKYWASLKRYEKEDKLVVKGHHHENTYIQIIKRLQETQLQGLNKEIA